MTASVDKAIHNAPRNLSIKTARAELPVTGSSARRRPVSGPHGRAKRRAKIKNRVARHALSLLANQFFRKPTLDAGKGNGERHQPPPVVIKSRR